METKTEECIKICNELLRGEISAVETYDQALEKYADTPVALELSRIRSEHSMSAGLLASNILDMGGEPDKDSGAWGSFANTIQGTANLFGQGSAIESLQKGEEKGRSDYEDALKDNDVMAECKVMIREELLPPIREHIATLESISKAS
jgi:hypothetical protein